MFPLIVSFSSTIEEDRTESGPHEWDNLSISIHIGCRPYIIYSFGLSVARGNRGGTVCLVGPLASPISGFRRKFDWNDQIHLMRSYLAELLSHPIRLYIWPTSHATDYCRTTFCRNIKTHIFFPTHIIFGTFLSLPTLFGCTYFAIICKIIHSAIWYCTK